MSQPKDSDFSIIFISREIGILDFDIFLEKKFSKRNTTSTGEKCGICIASGWFQKTIFLKRKNTIKFSHRPNRLYSENLHWDTRSQISVIKSGKLTNKSHIQPSIPYRHFRWFWLFQCSTRFVQLIFRLYSAEKSRINILAGCVNLTNECCGNKIRTDRWVRLYGTRVRTKIDNGRRKALPNFSRGKIINQTFYAAWTLCTLEAFTLVITSTLWIISIAKELW